MPSGPDWGRWPMSREVFSMRRGGSSVVGPQGAVHQDAVGGLHRRPDVVLHLAEAGGVKQPAALPRQ